jgi:hypothetical protein
MGQTTVTVVLAQQAGCQCAIDEIMHVQNCVRLLRRTLPNGTDLLASVQNSARRVGELIDAHAGACQHQRERDRASQVQRQLVCERSRRGRSLRGRQGSRLWIKFIDAGCMLCMPLKQAVSSKTAQSCASAIKWCRIGICCLCKLRHEAEPPSYHSRAGSMIIIDGCRGRDLPKTVARSKEAAPIQAHMTCAPGPKPRLNARPAGCHLAPLHFDWPELALQTGQTGAQAYR